MAERLAELEVRRRSATCWPPSSSRSPTAGSPRRALWRYCAGTRALGLQPGAHPVHGRPGDDRRRHARAAARPSATPPCSTGGLRRRSRRSSRTVGQRGGAHTRRRGVRRGRRDRRRRVERAWRNRVQPVRSRRTSRERSTLGQASRGIKVMIDARGEGVSQNSIRFQHPFGYLSSEILLDDGTQLMIGFGGDAERCDPADIAGMQASLDETLPGYEVLDATAHDWLADEFSRGTWAIHRPGWYEHHHAAMRRPEGNVILAGSDLANGWAGFIDGAIESGLHAGAWAALNSRGAKKCPPGRSKHGRATADPGRGGRRGHAGLPGREHRGGRLPGGECHERRRGAARHRGEAAEPRAARPRARGAAAGSTCSTGCAPRTASRRGSTRTCR